MKRRAWGLGVTVVLILVILFVPGYPVVEQSGHDDEGASFGFDVNKENGMLPISPKVDPFPEPIRQWDTVIKGENAFFSLELSEQAKLHIQYGIMGKNQSITEIKRQGTRFDSLPIQLNTKHPIIVQVKWESANYTFSTAFTIHDGRIENQFSVHSDYQLTDKRRIQAQAVINELEANNTPQTANVITPGNEISGAFSTTDKIDYYRVNLTYPAFINIRLQNVPVGSDYDIYLYSSTNLTTSIWKGENSKNAEELGYNLNLKAGTYYIKVIPYSNPRSDVRYTMSYQINKHWPVLFRTDLSSGFSSTHLGIDILPTAYTQKTTTGCVHPDYIKPCYSANSVVASFAGTVAYVNTNPRNTGNYGVVVYINSLLDGKWIQTRYAHMWSTTMTIGTTVKAGQVIGQMGNTGMVYGTTGVHTHYETRTCSTTGCSNVNASTTPVNPKGYFPGY